MEINGFTFIAQIVNFLILVFLLKRFLYHPIVQAMERREQAISDRLQAAQQKRQEAQQEAERYQQMQQELANQQAAMLAQVKLDVEQARKELLQSVRDEVAASQTHWKEVVRRQQDSFLRELRHRAIEQIQDTIRLALVDLADTDLEQRAIEVFIQRIQHLDRAEQQTLCSMVIPSNHHSEPIFIHSAFEIPDEWRQRIIQVVQERLPNPAQFRFETTPELICGIELRTPGCKLAWSLENYLNTLEESIVAVLEEETAAAS